MRGQTVMAGCQVNEYVLQKMEFVAVAVAEILALLRPHVLGSAGLRPHFFVRRPQKRAHIQNQDRRKEHTF